MSGDSPGSYELVHYMLRPAKAVERKMLSDVFRRLSHFAPLEQYRYVGFGAVYYTDFLLFHRTLGIKKMVNIEEQVKDQARFRFNRPFSFIDCMFESSTTALPKVSWQSPAIVWLDYDGTLSPEALADIATVCSAARSGSMLVVSFRARATDFGKGADMWPKVLEGLRRLFGDKVPHEVRQGDRMVEVTKEGLATTGAYPRVLARIALDEMAQVCRERAAGAKKGRAVRFEQLLDFEYHDSVRMVTVGGVIVEDRDDMKLRGCAFDRLPFVVREGKPHHDVLVPRLTHREVQYLDQHIPMRKKSWRRLGLSKDVIQQYEKVYRWFPRFAETELQA